MDRRTSPSTKAKHRPSLSKKGELKEKRSPSKKARRKVQTKQARPQTGGSGSRASRKMEIFKRNLTELRKHAVLYWPPEILIKAGDASSLPLLLESQDKFIGILSISTKEPQSWRNTLREVAGFRPKLFLKHLMVLTNVGGESLNKLSPIRNRYNDKKMRYLWHGTEYEYRFKAIGEKCSLTNGALGVDSRGLLAGDDLSPKMEDVIMLLLYGSSAIDDTLPTDVKEQCLVGALMGDKPLLEKFVKENYIRVSRQVGGATANALGQATQDYVIEQLKKHLPGWQIRRDSTLPNVSHTGGDSNTNFDVVAISPARKYFGIEVTFQYTTNSTIERKSREAERHQRAVHAAGHKICYVIDGAGNINVRAHATETLCRYSDCTVAMSESEIAFLAKYLLS